MECNRNGYPGLHHDHSIFVLHTRPGHRVLPQCATAVRADLRTRSWKEGQYFHDNYSGSWLNYGGYSLL